MGSERYTGYLIRNKLDRLCQGDVLRDIKYYSMVRINDDEIDYESITFPLVYVLTQECDLLQEKENRGSFLKNNDKPMLDKNNNPIFDIDKSLISILLAPIYNFDIFVKGEHLEDIVKCDEPDRTYRCSVKNSDLRKPIQINQNPRYHFINLKDERLMKKSVIDFKHYFTMSLNELTELRETNYVCTLGTMFKNDVSHRFSNYLSRIGLPIIK